MPSETRPPAYLQHAATALADVLRARHPEYTWTTEIREPQRTNPERPTANTLGQHHASVPSQHTNTIDDRDTPAATAGTTNDHHRQQAA